MWLEVGDGGRERSVLKAEELSEKLLFDVRNKISGRKGFKRQMAECRICQEEGEEDDMEAPCACNGTIKVSLSLFLYLHFSVVLYSHFNVNFYFLWFSGEYY